MKECSPASEKLAHVYRTHVKEVTNADVLRVLERDFGDQIEHRKESQDDRKFMDILTDNIRMNDEGHDEMPLPMRDDHVVLPDHREAAVKRAQGLRRHLLRKPSYHADCVEFMQEMDSEAIATKLLEQSCEFQFKANTNCAWCPDHYAEACYAAFHFLLAHFSLRSNGYCQ